MVSHKVQLEAHGHTAVEPSEFFLVEESSSTLLIILRNEDIAEHICEVQALIGKLSKGFSLKTILNERLCSQVPYLLSLKKSAGVQFAGIDEPGDVVNQTHQELFVKGGFIMFDRAALESLRLRTYFHIVGLSRQKVKKIIIGVTCDLCEFKVT